MTVARVMACKAAFLQSGTTPVWTLASRIRRAKAQVITEVAQPRLPRTTTTLIGLEFTLSLGKGAIGDGFAALTRAGCCRINTPHETVN
jgi:hypothetical protein